MKYDRKEIKLEELGPEDIDRHTLSMIPSNSRVLELGCATGYHSHYLNTTKHCQVIGVDLNPDNEQFAKPAIEKFITGNLDDQRTWAQITQYSPYDVVLASNVLEHLTHPWWVISQCYQVLKKGGFLVVAVPNIAFWRSRLRLLQGIWEYQDYGIFDRTHNKFFTVNSIVSAVTAAGFTIVEKKYDPAGGAKWLTPILRLFPNAYAHQVALKAVKT